MPKRELLADKGVKSVTIIAYDLPYILNEKLEKKEDLRLLQDSLMLNTYFFNPNGELDSVYGYSENKLYFRGIYSSNNTGKRIRFAHFEQVGILFEDITMDLLDSEIWQYRKWAGGKVLEKKLCRKDSAVFSSTTVYSNEKGIDSICKTFDFKKNSAVIIAYKRKKIMFRQIEQWHTKDGKPDSLIISFYERRKKGNGLRDTIQRFYVDEEGRAVNDRFFVVGRVHTMNCYQRYDKCEGITTWNERCFTGNKIIQKSEILEDLYFSGTIARKYYTFKYSYFEAKPK